MKEGKQKARFTTKLFFWLFAILMILAVFLFWSARDGGFAKAEEDSGANISLIIGIVALCLSIFFGLICFVRFIRSRSVASGLFFTTTFSTAIFLGTSQLLPVIIPPTAAAFTNSPEATNNGLSVIVGLAQVGLFAIWFIFLLFTIYLHVRPVKRIDKYLQRIVDGESVKKIRIGRAKQYRGIEEKLKAIAEAKSAPHSVAVIDSDTPTNPVVCTQAVKLDGDTTDNLQT